MYSRLVVIRRDSYLDNNNLNWIMINYQKLFAMSTKMKIRLLGLGILFFVVGCNLVDVLDRDSKSSNSFSMSINGQLWQPSLIDNDASCPTFECEYTLLNDNPFYTIIAYKDSQSRTDFESENIFRIQIMNVDKIGVYNTSDTYGDFNSYAKFEINESGIQKIYENSTTKINSFVRIDEMLPIASSIDGIRGSFSGILYNNENLKDSIVIDNCTFTFKKLNCGNFCHEECID
jgi:hypothetical protein